jgi:phosphoglycerate dehydrogenase-like enzyme
MMDRALSCRSSGASRPDCSAMRNCTTLFPGLALLCLLGIALNAHAAATAGDAAANAATADAALIGDLGLQAVGSPVRERPGWHAPQTILVTAEIRAWLPELAQIAPDVRFVDYSPTTTPADIQAVDASIGVCAPEVLERARRLQWIQWLGAGVERCVQQSLVHEHRPLITNLQRAAAPSMAEHVLGMMLALSHRLDYFILQQPRGRWITDLDAGPQPQDLAGRTLLVVGLGGIGTEVARRAHAFGMTVIATRASGHAGPEFVSHVGSPDELLALARQADFIVNCAPLTPQTTGIFNREFFAALKPTAFFLSVGRGRSTVTDDLTAALQARRIAGAGLDVTDPEPLPPTSPLWRLPNVIITPHVSGNTSVAMTARRAIVRENLRRYIAGEPMLAVVDIERGY